MSETTITPLSEEARKRIRRIVEYHYGFIPQDEDVDRVDDMVRNSYLVNHEQRIIRELVASEISKEFLAHRENLGSLDFERVWLEKSMFRYLTYASMCYRAGIPVATISLCRTALEWGLRERLAEELAKKVGLDTSELPEAILKKIKSLSGKGLSQLVEKADAEGLISKQEIDDQFRGFRRGEQSGRKVLDKIIHGDIAWLVDFVRDLGDTEVIGAKDVLHEAKIISEIHIDLLALAILNATYKIGAILYYANTGDRSH